MYPSDFIRRSGPFNAINELYTKSNGNHSIKKWSVTSPFILNDNIICFIGFLDVLVQKMVTKKNINNLGLPDLPLYLGLSPKFDHIFRVLF